MGRILFGMFFGALCIVGGGLAWLSWGNPPVAVTDKPFPYERFITHIPLDARIQKELVARPPVVPDEPTFVAGARIYADRCAVCHGYHGKPSEFGPEMYPDAPPLWEQHRNSSVVGVSDDPPGETFWKVKNGIRLTGMPTYRNILTDTEIWQVSILLANADKPLPPAALQLLGAGPKPSSTTTKQPSAEDLGVSGPAPSSTPKKP